MPTIEYDLPNQIDGEPDEVAADALDTAERLTRAANEVVVQAAAMIRNAELTALIDNDPEAQPEDHAEALENRPITDKTYLAERAAGFLVRAVAQLRENVK